MSPCFSLQYIQKCHIHGKIRSFNKIVIDYFLGRGTTRSTKDMNKAGKLPARMNLTFWWQVVMSILKAGIGDRMWPGGPLWWGDIWAEPCRPEEASHAEFWGTSPQTAEKWGPEEEYAWRLRGQLRTGGLKQKGEGEREEMRSWRQEKLILRDLLSLPLGRFEGLKQRWLGVTYSFKGAPAQGCGVHRWLCASHHMASEIRNRSLSHYWWF